MFSFNSIEDTLPPWRPGLVVLITPCTGMPSLHQDNFAGGLLELESHVSVASVFGLNSGGSFLILTVSGGTKIRSMNLVKWYNVFFYSD